MSTFSQTFGKCLVQHGAGLSSLWILSTGFWNDSAKWKDDAVWIDSL